MSQEITTPEVSYKPIPKYPSYRAGTDGSIWCKSVGVWKRMATFPDDDGYSTVGLWRDGKHSTKKVHRLVLEAFVGPCPPGHEAAHNPDPTRSNCRLDNLAWKTKKQNAEDRNRHGNTHRGERNHNAKVTPEIVIQIRAQAESGDRQYDIANRFGLSQSTVNGIIQRKKWAHIA